jgi:hypothetical protein
MVTRILEIDEMLGEAQTRLKDCKDRLSKGL